MHFHHGSADIFDMHSREQQHASREIKKYLLSRERNDWEWPPQASPGVTSDNISGLPPSIRPHALVEADPVGWRELYYGSSDDYSSAHEAPEEDERVDSAQDAEYKFESADTVGSSLAERSTRRKRRKKAKLQEELGWNEGLRCFVDRRNAWTSARKRDDRSASALILRETSNPAATKEGAGVEELREVTTGDEVTTGTLSNGTSIPAERTECGEAELGEPRPDSSGHLQPPSSSHSRPASRGRGGKRVATPQAIPGPMPDSDPLVPIARPLIDSHNTLRAAIQSKAYPSIYTQMVHSARTPSVPIPLADMTRALVVGWKDAGEWPPRGTSVTANGALLSSRRLTVNGREEVIGQVLPAEDDDRRAGNGIGGHGISIPHGLSIGEGLLSHHHHLKKGVDGVKRALKLSGSHEKSGSHGSETAEAEGSAAAAG